MTTSSGYQSTAFTLANQCIANCRFTGKEATACNSCITKAIALALEEEAGACAFIAEKRLFGREQGWHTRNDHKSDAITEINEIARLIKSRKLCGSKNCGP